MNKLEEYRQKIDALDDKIAEAYDGRMALSKLIGIEKNNIGKHIGDPAREKNILNRLAKAVDPGIRVYLKQLYAAVFDTSRAYQSRFSNVTSDITEKLSAALREKPDFPESATVACQGVEGSYSYLATERLFPLSDITYFKSFEAVFNAVESGLCEYGMLPIENSSVGSVDAVYDLMKRHKFYIVKSIRLRVEHSLLAPKGVKLSDIKEVFSHNQALSQCGGYLAKLKGV
ncbi:MAG: chorismate mutase, partial [Clostridiales bacterium]|nr:chorismate mutase [Clostridiales bacterium]